MIGFKYLYGVTAIVIIIDSNTIIEPSKPGLIVEMYRWLTMEGFIEIKRYEYRIEFVINYMIDFISWRKRNIYVHKQVAGITRYATL